MDALPLRSALGRATSGRAPVSGMAQVLRISKRYSSPIDLRESPSTGFRREKLIKIISCILASSFDTLCSGQSRQSIATQNNH